MKKIAILFAMIFVVGMAMGQTITNEAETEQIGNHNEVLVKQIGDQNDAASHQYGNENDASVLQDGDENIGLADQLRGDRNSADVLQVGNSNEGYIIQGMISGYYSDYGVTTYNMTSHDNNGSIEQEGIDNYSDLLQVGNNNNGSLNQSGNNNKAYAYQGWAGDWWGFGGVRANLFSNNSTATIEQINNDNNGQIYQYGGNNNTGNIHQNGNFNAATISQGFIYDEFAYDFTNPVFNTQNNFASINQIGSSNTSKLFQLGNGNSFKLNQTNDGNSVGFNPSAVSLLDKRNAFFAQDGSNNRFAGVVLNANNIPVFKPGLAAEQYNGATLSHESYQKGDYNDIGLRQGQDDFALIQQDGLGNGALLWQQGADQNVATMVQKGDYNTSSVVQIQQ